MKREKKNRMVGCKVDDVMKTNFEKACALDVRSESNVLQILIRQYIREKLGKKEESL